MIKKMNGETYADFAVSPGRTLIEVLDSVNMSQKDLALRLGMAKKTINEIIKGKAPVTSETAVRLENVLGIDASFWLNMEANYQADLARLQLKPKEEEIEIARQLPYSDIARLGFVQITRQPEEKTVNLRKFFAVSSLQYLEALPLASNFRRKVTKNSSFFSLLAWLRLAEIVAQERLENVSDFSRENLSTSLESLRALTFCENNFDEKIKEICAKSGIAVVFVPHIKGTSVQGAAKWLSPNKALVAVSLRYKWADIFWFSLFHEIGHLYLKNQSKKQTFVDFNNEDTKEDIVEREADRFAANTLIPQKSFDYFVKKGDFSEGSVNDFAKNLKIASHIIWGRLSKENFLTWAETARYRFQLAFSESR